MPYGDLQSYLADLERAGELKRVRVPVDPVLEITEVYSRIVREGGPALLFEQVRGSRWPLVINLFGNARRVRMALGREPGEFGETLVKLAQELNPPSPGALWRNRRTLLGLRNMRVKRVGRAISQEIIEQPGDMGTLPGLQCWPGDGGRFLTWPLVLTRSPKTGRSNLGVYRMHVYSATEAGLHWQLAKGGGFHYSEAEETGQPLEVAVALGADPALMLASVLPLPEFLEELVFSGLLRGRPTRVVPGKTIRGMVPASAEFVLEGVAMPGERRMEGPFGDHLGHYSQAAEFPVFRLRAITRRRNPVFPAAVVGRPPQEERWWGYTSQAIMNPLLKLIRPDVSDLHAYYQAGFVNLAVASTRGRYAREPLRTALGLLGEGQLSLTKCLFMVDPEVDVRDIRAVLRAVRDHFRPEHDFTLLSRVALDSLDFTSYQMHLGSRMVVDATTKGPWRGMRWLREETARERDHDVGARGPSPLRVDPKAVCPEIKRWRLVEDALLAVQVEHPARRVVERLVAHESLRGAKMVVAVSPDVNIEDDDELVWGIFMRFDPARDVVFTEMGMTGAQPVYRGVMGIDATWKPGYPEVIRMDEETVRKVDRRWGEYGL